MGKEKILLLEPDSSRSSLLQSSLELFGRFNVIACGTAQLTAEGVRSMSPAAVVLNADKHEGLSEELTASDIPTVCVTGSHPGASKIMRNGTSNEPQPFSPLLLLNAVEGVITSRDQRLVPLISVPAL